MSTVHRLAGRLLCWLLLAGLCLPAYARKYDVHPPVDPHHVDGYSIGGPVDLSSTWLAKQGDDPSYADAGLDDSHWQIIESGIALQNYGWQNVDTLWYRTHLRIPAGEHNLALSLSWFCGSYQIYVNGLLVGSSGAFPSGGVNATSADRRYSIPDAALASGQVTIAIRAAVGRISEHGLDPAGLIGITTVLLGPEPVLADASSLWYFRDNTSNVANVAFEIIVLLIALALALTLPSESEYLTLVIYLTAVTALNALDIWIHDGNHAPSDPLILLRVILAPIRSIAGLEFVRLVLGLRRTRLFTAYEWFLALFSSIGVFWLRHLINISPQGLSHSAVVAANYVTEVIFLPADLGLPLLALWVWWKRRNRTALLIFVPLLISAAVDYIGFIHYILFQLHFAREQSFAEPPIQALHVGWDEITTFSFSGTLLLFLVLRTLRIARERAEAANEIAAAKTVQQVLLARASQPTPGFLVESVYLPASEVGGDFFLVSPGPDGSLVAIVGDVSGKGLLAAMRVSMILGVLRREDSREPAAILNALNEALLTQGEMGFTTACCVRIERAGRYTLANAGHIAPYSCGAEVETPPALPLGLAGEQAYETVHGEIVSGERLVLMSDGVVEARSPQGELYGFERLPHLTRMPAQDIAELAQKFGQEDDITVLTIGCLA